jgi:ribosome biogenesis protein Tsr3
MLNAGDQRQAIISALGEKTYLNCGMDKLNKRERENLFSLVGAYPVVSYTESAAEAYMSKQGWRQIQVLGAVVVDTVWDEKHIVVSDQYELYLLDPFIVPYLPDPGVYLASGSGSSWNILFPNGEEGSFLGKKLE